MHSLNFLSSSSDKFFNSPLNLTINSGVAFSLNIKLFIISLIFKLKLIKCEI